MILLFCYSVSAQQSIGQYVIFGNSGVEIGSSSVIGQAKVGSRVLIQTNGTSQLNGDLHSDGRIDLANGNTINGNITASNATVPSYSGYVLSVGSNTTITGSIHVQGDILINSGVVNGPVVMSGTYSGPLPTTGPATQGVPSLPTLPQIHAGFDEDSTNNNHITGTETIIPGVYGNMSLGGNKTVTFQGPGVYVFNSIKNSGNFNKFIFDFNNLTSGSFTIIVLNDVDLYKISVGTLDLTIGGQSPTNADIAARVFMQVNGTGSTSSNGQDAWSITNGASGNNQSTWCGTVLAPNGNIDVGSGSSQSKIIGALWSGKKVLVQSGVSVTFAPLLKPNANAGPDQNINCPNPSTTLVGSSTTSGAQYSWSKVGGTIPGPTNTSSIVVSSAGTYVLTVTSPGYLFPATDTAVVTSILCVLPYYPPQPTGKTDLKIGSELLSLYQNYGNVIDDGRTLFIIVNDKVLIDVIAWQGKRDSVVALLLSPTYGMTDTITNGPGSLVVTGLYPINRLNLFDQEPMRHLISFVRPSYPAISGSGLVQTLGDSAQRSNYVRNGFGVSGEGVKVGVLSDSYSTLSNNDVNNHDLPGAPTNTVNPHPVQVLKEWPFGQRSDEGRAMLQIVHDVAPKAKLAFRTGFLTAGDFAVGIKELASADCDVVCDDITFITEPFFKPGVVANAVQAVKDSGVTYITAAGNFGQKSYEAIFNPFQGAVPFGLSGKAHDFGGGDIFQNDSVKGSATQPIVYTLVLQWDNDYYSQGNNSGAQADLDAYALDNMGNLIGFNRINIEGDPTEVLTFVVTQNTAINIMIVNASADSNAITSNIRIKYVVFRGELKINEYAQGGSTIVGQANSPAAITVGATLYTNTPAFGVNVPTIASFSSVGGTNYLGSPAQKPDIVAPNGVNTTVNFGSIDYDADGIPNFFGTSAAAPHVAGAAALIIQAKQKFYFQDLSPDDLKYFITSNAIDMNTSGFDLVTGNGFLQLDSAVRSLANPTPNLITLELADSSLLPGAQPMTIFVHGNYLSDSTVVLLGTDTLETTILSTTLATTILPVFSGPAFISAYTPPITPSLLDGGISNSISVTGYNKKNVLIKADNKTKKYGEDLPAFTATVFVDGDSLHHTAYTLQDLGLTNITYNTNASDTSNVGIYSIMPSRYFNPTDSADAALLALYNYDSTTGILTIEKLPVTVVPNDTTIVYGQAIGGFSFHYEIDSSAVISNPANLLNSIQSLHQSQLNNTVVGMLNGVPVSIINGVPVSIINGTPVSIINGVPVSIINGVPVSIINHQSVSVVNGEAVITPYTLSDTQLEDMNFMASSNSIQNARQVISQYVSNGTVVYDTSYIVDVTQETLLDYNVNPDTTSMLSSIAQVNARGMVNFTTLLNGEAASLINGTPVSIINGTPVSIINGVPVSIINGTPVSIINGQNTAVIVDEEDLSSAAGGLQSMNMVTGNSAGQQYIIPGSVMSDNLELSYRVGVMTVLPADISLKAKDSTKVYGDSISLDSTAFTIVSGVLNIGDTISKVSLTCAGTVASAAAGTYPIIPSGAQSETGTNLANYNITYLNGVLTVTKAVLTVKADSVTRLYGEPNPVLTATYTGFKNGETFATSGITGAPLLTTTATTTSPVGTYPISISQGTLSSNNYSFAGFIPGLLTINSNPCLITHNPSSNISSTTKVPTTLWLSIVTKVSGQLAVHGDYISFNAGTITLTNVISNPQVTNFPIPNGRIVAVNGVSAPETSYDAATNTWTTKVPPGFSSTSDIFITGAIINSSNGFTKKNGPSSTVSGIFYSNVSFSDQWSYAMAAYQPQFTYSSIADPGEVSSVNGNYKAGTPTTQINNLYGGGNNYTGSSSSFENFTACTTASPLYITRSVVPAANEVLPEEKDRLMILPNPAKDQALISFTSVTTGTTSVKLYDISGSLISVIHSSMSEPGKVYNKTINISGLPPGVYLVRFQNNGEVITKKLLITR